jgi:outer membrane protein OmpA-like peptidoglycan-associated protein
MKKILLIALLLTGSASAQQIFNVPVQPPEMRPGYGLENKGLHTAVPYGREGVDCVVNPVSMSYSYTEVETVELVAGQVFTIPVNVLFDFDKDFVRPEGLVDLSNFYSAITEGGAEEILIIGHTDSRGTDEYNLDLGLRRAGAVALVLAGFGFDDANIEIDSAGESFPVADNSNSDGSDNPEGRQLNRRVDVEIVRVAEKEVVNTEVVRRAKNPQIFHRLASNHSVACSGGVTPNVAIPVGGNTGLTPDGGIVITTVPR